MTPMPDEDHSNGLKSILLNRECRRDLAIVLVLGMVLRVTYHLDFMDSIFWGDYVLDSLAYHSWAERILAGQAVDGPFFRAPLYPHLIALLYRLCGTSH